MQAEQQTDLNVRGCKRKLIAVTGTGRRQAALVITQTLCCCGFDVQLLEEQNKNDMKQPEPGTPGYAVTCLSPQTRLESFENAEPLILLWMDEKDAPSAETLNGFPDVVMEYGTPVEGYGFSRCVTFSLENDAADYAAHNVRRNGAETVFEMVGAGVIGRVRLCLPADVTMRQLLAGAAATLCAGAPFAKVLECVNGFSIPEKSAETRF